MIYYRGPMRYKNLFRHQIMIPGHGMIFPIAATVITGFINSNQYMQIGADPFKIIQFIEAFPHFWKMCVAILFLSTILNTASWGLG